MPAGPSPILAVVGPTASGKTAYAIERAGDVDGEIISIDSRQIYRGFIIGTAQPTGEELAAVPHHLINTLDPGETITAGRYVELIHAAMADIVARGKVPILCGGTGLYVRALRLGLTGKAPAADPELRRKVAAQIEAEGAEAALAQLAEVDPAYAATIHPNNLQRLSRALEILEATGRPPSRSRDWETGPAAAVAGAGAVTIEGVGEVAFDLVGLEWPRDVLYERINRRVEAMIEAGWQAEVEGLLSSGVPGEAHPMQGVGYRELAAVAQGTMTLEEAVPIIQQRTRNFARRQMTWFRQEPVRWVEAGG